MSVKKEWFIQKIQVFLENDESNKLRLLDGSYIFNPDAVIGIAAGDDPIFKKYKNIIGDFHLTPKEAFSWYCMEKGISLNTDNLSVIAYILPINMITKKENYEYSNKYPSERWAHTRLFGEQSNMKLQQYLVDELKKVEINAFAPAIERRLFRVNPKILASNWSHRHMAFAAGLGSFGLSDGFINIKGKAMRCGSLIVNCKLLSDAQNRSSDPYEYCINCGDCITRCPVNAISFRTRHDKLICSQHVMGTIPYIKENYNINIYACGLCQVGVSCTDGIPKK